MKLRYKITGTLFVLGLLAVSSLALLLSYESDCPTTASANSDTSLMKAVVYHCYGSADVLEVKQVERPSPAANEILVKVEAAAINPLDWHYMRGSPYIMRLESGLGSPADPKLGVDFSGTVEAIGSAVSRFAVGDEVYGGASGAFAEYLTVAQDRAVAHKPANITFSQAAATPIAAITALQALRDKGDIQAGQRVLINGASGGVGTFAVQIAKSLGAEVTGVCSTRNLEMVRSLGADYVIDYKQTDYTESELKYDLIVDMVGNHSLSKNRRVLKPNGTMVIVGGPKGNWISPFISPIKALLQSPFTDQRFATLLAEMKQDDLVTLAELLESGQMAPVIDQHFSLSDVPSAIRYSETGRARGKIIIDL